MARNDDNKDEVKNEVKDETVRPSPWLDDQKLRRLASALRLEIIVDRIWRTSFTEEERQTIAADKSMGPDIIDIWAKFKGVSPTRAILELAREANLLADPDFHRLSCSLGEEMKHAEGLPLPVWDKQRGELWLGNTLVKRLRRLKVATNAILILDAFQELGWPECMDDPLPPNQNLRQSRTKRLQDTIKSLNNNLKLIRFRGTGRGNEIAWDRR
jgi:hypothetical protein